MQGNGDSGDVHELEGAHADAKLLLGRGVDGGDIGAPGLEEPNRLVQPRYEEPVHDESGTILASDRRLADGLLGRPGGGEDLGGGSLVPDDLDQAVLGGMVEVVEADHPRRVLRRLGEIAHVERGGVGSQDGVGVDVAEPAEDLTLDVEVLEHGLDDEVHLFQGVPVRGARHAVEDGPGTLLFEDLPSHALFEGRPDPGETRRHLLVVQIDEDHRVPLGRDLLGDPRPHVSGSDDGKAIYAWHLCSSLGFLPGLRSWGGGVDAPAEWVWRRRPESNR